MSSHALVSSRRAILRFVALALCLAGAAPLAWAADPTDDYLARVSQVGTKQGFTNDFSGVWQGDNTVRFGKWLYVLSCKPWRFRQFEVDPASAALADRGDALVMTNAQPLALVHAVSRKLADGSGMIYLFFSSHERPSESSLYAFSLDAKTGAVALKGQTKLPADHIQWAMSPKDTRLYAICEGRNIAAYRFAEDGLPVEDGMYASRGYDRNPGGFFSADGARMYVTATPDAANPNGRIDAYDCEVASGKLMYTGALSLPVLPHKNKGGAIRFCGATPDGTQFYVLFADGGGDGSLYVLKPDSGTNGLAVVSSDKPPAAIGSLNFSADGKSGFYVGSNNRFNWFTRDPATGALTLAATSGFDFWRLRGAVADPAHGNLFVVYGGGVDSFKVRK